jgi:phosphoglycolate phosphatase-like HAD superfamily hydrolase
MIGDGPADAGAAANAGCAFVWARYGFGARKFAAPPDTPHVMAHARELGLVLSRL